MIWVMLGGMLVSLSLQIYMLVQQERMKRDAHAMHALLYRSSLYVPKEKR